MRDITKLHPTLQIKLAQLKEECTKAGLKIGIGECVRTVAEQDALYAQGRTAPGNKVTNAKGSSYSSMHQWGVAFDFYRNDGKGAFYDADGFFTKVGKIGQGIGLEWGGSWTSPVDKPHFQLKDWGSTPTKLKSLYGTPEKFFATWGTGIGKTKPAVAVPTVKSGSSGTNAKTLQKDLNYVGNYGLAEDGKFGTKSVTALKDWQKKNGLKVDGIYGNGSYKKMMAVIG